jgi:S-adenosylmethionine hydrolase
MSPIITLTTDFGLGDGYVAAMKGVILQICPNATLVDISHGIPPQDILHGAFVLSAATGYFPPGSVHLAVVDPGVGTSRHPILLVTPNGSYVAPDNGLLTYILLKNGARPAEKATPETTFMEILEAAVPESCAAYVLNQAKFWHEPVSDTFHGRDIFAPVAAHLAAGVPPDFLGDKLDRVHCAFIPEPAQIGGSTLGHIIYVDHYGNLVSNIPLGDPTAMRFTAEIAGRQITGPSRSYASASGLLVIKGSHGYLEIAYRNGSAARVLNSVVGTPLTVRHMEAARKSTKF